MPLNAHVSENQAIGTMANFDQEQSGGKGKMYNDRDQSSVIRDQEFRHRMLDFFRSTYCF